MLNNFIATCNFLGTDSTLIQGPGGNISFKDNNRMFIKSSGFCLYEITKDEGISDVDFLMIKNYFKKQDSFDKIDLEKEKEYSDILSKVGNTKFRPSMETGFHACLGKIVIHTHPVYLNAILCCIHAERIINQLFSKYEYQYLTYTAPGYNLSYKISTSHESKIYFLANHGLIINCESFEEGVALTQNINAICLEFLKESSQFFEFFKFQESASADVFFKAFYPDSAVFISKRPDSNNPKIKEIIAAHKYIDYIINNDPRLEKLNYFSELEVEYLNKMQSEKYRKTLMEKNNS